MPALDTDHIRRAQVADPRTHRRCPKCGKPIKRNVRGRQKKFCSYYCRDQARRLQHFAGPSHRKPVQRFKNGARYPYEGLPRNDAKNPCAAATFEAGFSGRGSGIQGPRHVIAIELDRDWTETTSTDGVRSFVSILRPPALRDDHTNSPKGG